MCNRVQNKIGARFGWILLLSASMLSGCAVGPNYHRPAVQTPPAFHGPEESQQLQQQTASFAFILGCVPLWTASGAGSVARQIMGTTVIGGMTAASVLGIFTVPAIFYLVERWSAATRARFVAPVPQDDAIAEGRQDA